MKIVFWSPTAGQCCTTSSMIAIATGMAIMERKKVKIISTNFADHSIQTSFNGFANDDAMMGSASRYGMDVLLRGAKAESLGTNEVESAGFSVSPRLSFYAAPSNNDIEYVENSAIEVIDEIANSLNKCTDYVFIDTKAGRSKLNQKVLQTADVVVICLNQNRSSVEKYFKEFNFNSNRIFVLVSNYDRDQKYSIKNIRKKFKKLASRNSGVLPHSGMFADSLNQGNLFTWVYRNKECKISDVNYSFIKELKLVTNKLLKFSNSVRINKVSKNGGKQ